MLRPRKTSRSASLSVVRSTRPFVVASNTIFPPSGARMPAIRCSSVVLPDPLVPTSATCSASPRWKCSISMTGTTLPSGPTYCLRSWESVTAIVAVVTRVPRRSFARGGMLLLRHFRQRRVQRVGPDLVALLRQVQVVGHDVLRDRAVGLEERVAAVEVADRLPAVVELRDRVVDLLDLRAALVSRLLAAREDGQQQDLRFRQLRADRLDDLRDAGGDAVGLVVGDVVRADHEDGDLRLDAFELAVLDAPKHVLRAVAADAEVRGVVPAEVAFPGVLLAVP